jgi:hypothetical protein
MSGKIGAVSIGDDGHLRVEPRDVRRQWNYIRRYYVRASAAGYHHALAPAMPEEETVTGISDEAQPGLWYHVLPPVHITFHYGTAKFIKLL